MNFRQLEYFISVAETKNISAAARKLNMAQPPLSRQLQLLEEELDVRLFRRSNKGVELTEAGNCFYLETKKLFAGFEEIKESVRDNGEYLRGNIRIAACYSTLPVFMQKMNHFLTVHPLVRFSILHGTVDEMLDLIREGFVDFLFLRTIQITDDKLSRRILQEDPLTLIINRNMDRLPDTDLVPLSYLEHLPLCLLDGARYPQYSTPLLNYCSQNGLKTRIVCECYDTSVAMMLAINGIAATVLPRSVVSAYRHPAIAVKQVQGLEMNSRPTVIWNPKRQFSRSSKEFLNYFLQPENDGLSEAL